MVGGRARGRGQGQSQGESDGWVVRARARGAPGVPVQSTPSLAKLTVERRGGGLAVARLEVFPRLVRVRVRVQAYRLTGLQA